MLARSYEGESRGRTSLDLRRHVRKEMDAYHIPHRRGAACACERQRNIRRRRRLDTHANLSYTIVGRPAGANLKNIFGFALGAELGLGQSGANVVFGESAGKHGLRVEPGARHGTRGETATPEAPAGEVSATVGTAHSFVNGLRASLGLSVDNNGAVLFRPGLTYRSR
jgi:hypothetical protein